MALGQNKVEYEVIEGWEHLPEGWSFVEVAGGRDRLTGPGVCLQPGRASHDRL